MCGQRRAEQSYDQLTHLFSIERLPSLNRRAAGISGRKPFEAILPPPEAAPGKVGDELLQAARRLEAGMRIGRRVHHDAAPGEWLDFVPDAYEQLAMRLDVVELHRCEVERQRQQQALRRGTIAGQLTHHIFVEHPFMRLMLIDDGDALVGLKENERVEDLEQSGASGLGAWA